MSPSWEIRQGDALEVLRTMPDGSAQCCVTSPPYWGGLRDYGVSGQLGLERAPEDYTARLVEVFREVRRVLRDDGTLWLNTADVFAASGKGGGGSRGGRACWSTVRDRKGFRMPPPGFKMKDLVLAAGLAESLRRDGWFLRSVIVWQKPAAVEPVRLDRPSVAHEYVYLLSKSETYAARNPGAPWWFSTVWRIAVDGRTEHPAEFPEELARRCLVSGSAEGAVVIDPFAGSGTVGVVALRNRRSFTGIELNPEYCAMAERRITEATRQGSLLAQEVNA